MRTEQNGKRRNMMPLGHIQNKILRSMDNLSRPLSRAFMADSGISSVYMINQAVKVLVRRGLIGEVFPENAPENSIWYALTADGHHVARALNYQDEIHPAAAMARDFYMITTNREGNYAPRK